jgi:hypothetical protein
MTERFSERLVAASEDASLTTGGISNQGHASSMTRPHASNELLVKFYPATDKAAMHSALSSIGGQVAEVLRGGPSSQDPLLVRVAIGQGMTVAEAIQIIWKRPGVAFAEPNLFERRRRWLTTRGTCRVSFGECMVTRRRQRTSLGVRLGRRRLQVTRVQLR